MDAEKKCQYFRRKYILSIIISTVFCNNFHIFNEIMHHSRVRWAFSLVPVLRWMFVSKEKNASVYRYINIYVFRQYPIHPPLFISNYDNVHSILDYRQLYFFFVRILHSPSSSPLKCSSCQLVF